MRILSVAEKPSAAKQLASLLSDNTQHARQGLNRYCWNFDFTYPLNGEMCEMTMTAVLGHMMQWEFPKEYKNWANTQVESLFTARLERRVGERPWTFEVEVARLISQLNDLLEKYVDQDTSNELLENFKELEQNLEREARRAQMLIIWTDCDREGENIGSEVKDICLKVNPRMIIKRAKFSAFIRREIHHACQHLIDLDMRSAAAVDARIELDLRVGAAMTRFHSMRWPKLHQDLDGKVLSYGSCQFPTLGFVVDQFNKRENFVPETFWKIETSVRNPSGRPQTIPFRWKRIHLFDELLTTILYEECVHNPQAVITHVNRKLARKWRPYPLTTVELQKAASRLLRMSSDRVMEIAEGLYRKGFVSYPRTETDQYPDNFDFVEMIQKQTHSTVWGDYAQGLLNSYQKPRKGHVSTLDQDEFRVYEYITRRFLACCSKDGVGNEVVLTMKITNEFFTARGLAITDRGYLQVYPYDKWSDIELPADWEAGREVDLDSLVMTEGKTTRPALLTEADLIATMDKNGIGTDATIHNHIKKIQEREYVIKEGNYFHPSQIGIALVNGYDRIGLEKSLTKPMLRRQTEERMKSICAGRLSKADMVQQELDLYLRVYESSKQNVATLDEAFKEQFGEPVAFQPRAFERRGSPPPPAPPPGGPPPGPPPRPPRPPRPPPPQHPAPPPPRPRPRPPPAAQAKSSQAAVSRHNYRPQPATAQNPNGQYQATLADPRYGAPIALAKPPHGPTGTAGMSNHSSSMPNISRNSDVFRPPMPYSQPAPNVGSSKFLPTSARVLNEPRCNCDLYTISKRVEREGDDYGEAYWVCSKVSRGCGFFQWQNPDRQRRSDLERAQNPAPQKVRKKKRGR